MRTDTKFRSVHILALTAIMVAGCHAEQPPAGVDHARMRQIMVQTQIASRGITDSTILNAFLKVERHRFVESGYQKEAYFDYPLPIGEGQTISQPFIVALMTALAGVGEGDNVLEIGTGSGYQAAILAELADSVFTIEIVAPLAARADSLLKELGYQNILVRTGDGYQGWPEHAPFDAVVVTCAAESVPQPLIDQLADRGRLVMPVGTDNQYLLLLTKSGDRIQHDTIAPVRFVPMTGEAQRR